MNFLPVLLLGQCNFYVKCQRSHYNSDIQYLITKTVFYDRLTGVAFWIKKSVEVRRPRKPQIRNALQPENETSGWLERGLQQGTTAVTLWP